MWFAFDVVCDVMSDRLSRPHASKHQRILRDVIVQERGEVILMK